MSLTDIGKWKVAGVMVAVTSAIGGAITFSQGWVTQSDLARAEARITAVEVEVARRTPLVFSVPPALASIEERLRSIEQRQARIEALLIQGQVRVGRPPDTGFGPR